MEKLPKVELHVHYDGACSLSILQRMCRDNGLEKDRFHYDDPEKFKKVVSLIEPQQSLVDFLKPFYEISFILSSKENLIQQSIYFCQLQAESNVIYSEVRYCPHLFTQRSGLSPEEVLLAIIEGLEQGQKKHGVKVRSILAMLRQCPEWSLQIADLAIKHKDKGIVGVDIAGDELQPMATEHKRAFQKAHDAGLHITVHAAESGPASNVTEAVNELHATRIGHGYHVLDDPAVYDLAKKKNVHFETCPTSSIYTNSASFKNHAIKTFAADRVNFGLNTDDPGVIHITLNHEFSVASSDIGLAEEQVIASVYNSAKSCFLPDDEKKELIAEIDRQVEQYRKSVQS